MYSRRSFLRPSLDEYEDAFFKAFMDTGKIPLFVSPPRFFIPAHAAHVDKWGLPDDWGLPDVDWRPMPKRELNTDWIKEARNYPLFQERQLNNKISYLPVTEDAYDGSKINFWEADELTQWRPLWTYEKTDLSLSIKRLLKMEAPFDEDHKMLLEWLKTRVNPIYLSGPEYHMLTNPGAYRRGIWFKPRRFVRAFFNAPFKTY